MAFNLVDSVRGLLNSDLISKAASSLGESEGGITSALAAAVPTVLGGIVSKGTSGLEGASSILDMAKGANTSGVLGNLGGLFSGSMNAIPGGGGSMVQRLLGDKMAGITSAISSYSGIRDSSVSSLLGMVAPMGLAVLGKHAGENNLSPSGFSSFLSTQKQSILSAFPSGLGSLAGMAGLGAIGGAVASARQGGADAVKSAAHGVETAAKKPAGFLVPLLLVLAVIVVGWLLVRGCKNSMNGNVSTDSTAATQPVIAPMASSEMIKVKLPDGTELEAYKGGIEDELVQYLNSTDPADSISRTRWFDFDHLNFKSSSAELTDSSMVRVNDIAAILKAYPRVTIKIGGYTDKTGDDPGNMALSQQRADTVFEAIKRAGANPTQLIGFEGYGSQFAKAAVDAPDDEKKLDRRISINVKSK